MLLAVAFLAFVSLGLPDAVLGVAWPSMRRAFALPLSELGVLLGAAMTGYLVSSFGSGAVVARAGVGRLLLWSSALTAASALGYAVAPAWPVVLLAALVAGLGAGAIDAGINAYAAERFSPRVVNWLHASYGVGAMLGPLLMSAVLEAGFAWRWGYGLIAAALLGMTACFAWTLPLWAAGPAAPAAAPVAAPGGPVDPPVGIASTLRRPVAWMSLLLFFLYTGLEVTVGQWTYSLLTESRGSSTAMAGTWTSAYWTGLTAGRLLAGILAAHLRVTALLRLGLGVAPVGALFLWLGSRPAASLIGLVGLGLAFAPIYPLLIAETPRRLGRASTVHAVGFQVAAAYLGTAAVPGAVGVLARWGGLEVLGPVVLGLTLCLFLAHEATLALGRATDTGASAGGGSAARLVDASRPGGPSLSEDAIAP